MFTVSRHPKMLNWRVIFFKKLYLFYSWLCCLCCCEGFSVVAGQGLLIVVASVVEEHRL